jgi:hypothetical protein
MWEWWVGLVLLGAGERSRAGALGDGRPWGAGARVRPERGRGRRVKVRTGRAAGARTGAAGEGEDGTCGRGEDGGGG